MDKRQRIGCLCLCFALLLTALGGCGGTAGRKPQVAVIVKSVNSDFFQKMQDGVNSAATEYQVAVSFTGPEQEEDYITQNALIQRAVDNGVDAIVLSAADYVRTAEAVDNALRHGIKVITIDSGVQSSGVSQFVGTDNVQAGRTAAQIVTKRLDTQTPIYVGIVNAAGATENMKQREKGFREAIQEIPNATVIATVEVDSTVSAATDGAHGLLENNDEINVLVGFNEWMTLGVGAAIRQSSHSVRGVGFDCNITSVAMLETGEMEALIVQNPFAMGYLGVKSAAKLISGEKLPKELYTDAVTVNKNNLYDDDVQKLLYRFN